MSKLKINRIFPLLAMLMIFGIIFAGCSSDSNADNNGNNKGINDGNNENNNIGDPDPITLKVHFGEDENFVNSFIEPAKEEFPHITFQHVEGNYEELIVAEEIPDILFHWNSGGYNDVAEYELTYDMTELIEQSGFDVSRFDENHLAEWKSVTQNDELWALPIMTSRFALLYNREIFDSFGLEYPEDGMDWEEVIALAEEVTGERDGTEYYGLYMPKHEAPIFWTAGNLVDPETDEAIWNENEIIKEYYELYERAYSIPGNPYIAEHWEEGGWTDLFEQGRLAMVAQFFGVPNPEANIDWDIATYPEPERGLPSRGWAFGISDTSEYKHEVMEVFDFWYSDEQLLNNTFIRGPLYVPFQHLYDSEEAQEKAIEREGDIWEGKNLDALFSLPVATPPESYSKYEETGIVEEGLYELVNGEEEKDINTIIREKFEEDEIRIEDQKGSE